MNIFILLILRLTNNILLCQYSLANEYGFGRFVVTFSFEHLEVERFEYQFISWKKLMQCYTPFFPTFHHEPCVNLKLHNFFNLFVSYDRDKLAEEGTCGFFQKNQVKLWVQLIITFNRRDPRFLYVQVLLFLLACRKCLNA